MGCTTGVWQEILEDPISFERVAEGEVDMEEELDMSQWSHQLLEFQAFWDNLWDLSH
jgi:hypothetical protein